MFVCLEEEDVCCTSVMIFMMYNVFVVEYDDDVCFLWFEDDGDEHV